MQYQLNAFDNLHVSVLRIQFGAISIPLMDVAIKYEEKTFAFLCKMEFSSIVESVITSLESENGGTSRFRFIILDKLEHFPTNSNSDICLLWGASSLQGTGYASSINSQFGRCLVP